MRFKAKILAFLLMFFGGVFALVPPTIHAHCPLCVVGAGAGLTLTRWIGVDDSITGLWVAALLGAISFWTYTWLARRMGGVKSFWFKPLLYVTIFLTTIWSFYKFGLVITMEKMYGFDKLTFGIIVGGVSFYLMELLSDLIIKLRQKSLFPYQRLVFSLGSTVALSVVFDILIGYYI